MGDVQATPCQHAYEVQQLPDDTPGTYYKCRKCGDTKFESFSDTNRQMGERKKRERERRQK